VRLGDGNICWLRGRKAAVKALLLGMLENTRTLRVLLVEDWTLGRSICSEGAQQPDDVSGLGYGARNGEITGVGRLIRSGAADPERVQQCGKASGQESASFKSAREMRIFIPRIEGLYVANGEDHPG
jgi:hypothetical protein